jgi:hypothetical protein
MLLAGDKAAVDAFSGHSRLAAKVLEEVARRPADVAFDEKQIARSLGLPASQETGVLGVLGIAEDLKCLQVVPGLKWRRVASEDELLRLSLVLEAVSHYKEKVHRDATLAEVVLTKPVKPSRLEDSLARLGWKIAELEVTSEAFQGLASSTKQRIIVMTPFLDPAGARWLVSLFERTPPTAERILILRHLSDPSHPSFPSGYLTAKDRLEELGVKVFDYSLPRIGGAGAETFHAKVVVRDDEQVYVGSSNMNRASLEHSMELGVLLRGEAAMEVSRIVAAILSIALPVSAGTK